MESADLSGVTWRKSSFSVNNGSCVEVAALANGQVALRNSNHPNRGVLLVDRAAVAAFIQGVKSSQFDDWRKSTFSANNGTCVEVAALADGRIALRNSNHPDRGVLLSDRVAVAAFIRGIKASQFDNPTG